MYQYWPCGWVVSGGSKSVWETEAVIASGVWIAGAACARCQRCGDRFGFSCSAIVHQSAAGFLPLPSFIRRKKKWWKIWHLKHFICSFPSPLLTSDISIIYCLLWMSFLPWFSYFKKLSPDSWLTRHCLFFFSSPSSMTHYLSRDEGVCIFFFSSLVREPGAVRRVTWARCSSRGGNGCESGALQSGEKKEGKKPFSGN